MAPTLKTIKRQAIVVGDLIRSKCSEACHYALLAAEAALWRNRRWGSWRKPPRTTHVDVAGAPHPLTSDLLCGPDTTDTISNTLPTEARTRRALYKMAKSIFQRKRDLVYLVFFIIHVPVMLGEFFSLETRAPCSLFACSTAQQTSFSYVSRDHEEECPQSTSLLNMYILLPRDRKEYRAARFLYTGIETNLELRDFRILSQRKNIELLSFRILSQSKNV